MSEPIGSSESKRRDLLPGVAAAILVAAALALGLTVSGMTELRVIAALDLVGASLFLAGAGFAAHALIAEARRRPPVAPPASAARIADASIRVQLERIWMRVRDLPLQIDWLGTIAPAASIVMGALIALALVDAAWSDIAAAAPSAFTQQVLGGALVVLAFPLLVFERILFARREERYPGTTSLEKLSRVPLAVCVLIAVAAFAGSLGFDWPWLLVRVTTIVVAIVAAEFVLRMGVQLFVPLPPLATRDFATSTFAGAISPTVPSFGEMNVAVRRQFGIDLSRSWAIAYARRAAIPVLAGMAVAAWLLTGVTALPIDSRAVYEQFGVPWSVMGPGLHVHLPWPFGILRNVEYGVVHEIPIVFSADASGAAASETNEPVAVGAEDAPPPSADRLWDASHPSEASYLIASAVNGTQSFQIVNIDLRIVYRIGLSDEAAEAAVYRIADPQALIRAAAGRMLVRHFSRYTLFEVLGQNRAELVNAFRSELQSRLDRLGSGIEVIAVVVEAIHPPPEAALSYQDVQAAEINSVAQIALSRGDAIRKMKSAEQTSIKSRNGALAASGELTFQARADSALFAGDRDAYAVGGQAYLFERWLRNLEHALPQAPLIVIDHRLAGPNAPTIDLRHFGPGADSAAPTSPDD